MRLESQQKDAIERGWAIVYVSPDGVERYIESVLNVYGEPSQKYKGMVYVFDANGDLEFDAHMFENLDAAKAACDADADRGWTISATEAAAELGVSRMRVNQLLNEGSLEGYKEGGTWRVYRHSVEDRLRKTRKPFEMHELEAYLGDFADDFNVESILEEATEIDYRTGNRYWRDGIDLAEICQRHDLTA